MVRVERKVCSDSKCNLRGWAGDDIYEDGVFNYNGDLVNEWRVLYELRRAVRAGTPVTTWVKTFLEKLPDVPDWLEANHGLATR